MAKGKMNKKVASSKEEAVRRVIASSVDFKRVFNSEQGKRVLAEISNECYLMRSTHTPGDPHGSSVKEGMRNAVLFILAKLNVDVSEMKQFLEESHNHVVE